jgi:hypothetical protein
MDNSDHQEAFESGHSRAQWAAYLLTANIFLALASLTISLVQIRRLAGFGANTRLAEIGFSDLADLPILIAWVVVSLTTAILFLMWVHRASLNLRLLGFSDLHYSPRLAVGAFLIPFANLFIPLRVVKEIWIKSDIRARDAALPVPGKEPAAPALIVWWWESWVFSTLISGIKFRFGDEVETVSQQLTVLGLDLTSDILRVLAAVLGIRLIRAIDRRQTESSRWLRHSGLPPPPPIFE